MTARWSDLPLVDFLLLSPAGSQVEIPPQPGSTATEWLPSDRIEGLYVCAWPGNDGNVTPAGIELAIKWAHPQDPLSAAIPAFEPIVATDYMRVARTASSSPIGYCLPVFVRAKGPRFRITASTANATGRLLVWPLTTWPAGYSDLQSPIQAISANIEASTGFNGAGYELLYDNPAVLAGGASLDNYFAYGGPVRVTWWNDTATGAAGTLVQLNVARADINGVFTNVIRDNIPANAQGAKQRDLMLSPGVYRVRLVNGAAVNLTLSCSVTALPAGAV